MRTEILYEDGDIMVVYKPAGFAVQTANVGCQDVVSELKNYIAKKDIGGVEIAEKDIGGMEIAKNDIGRVEIAKNGIGRMDIAKKDIGGMEIAKNDISRMDIARKDMGRKGIARRSIGGMDFAKNNMAKNNIRQASRKPGHPGNAAPYLGIIHRLDQPVEGLLVFARNQKAAAVLSTQLQSQGEIGFCKHYYAALYGQPAAAEGRLEDFICKKGNRAEVLETQRNSQPGKPVELLGAQKENQDESTVRRSGKAEAVVHGGRKGDDGKLPKESQSGKKLPKESLPVNQKPPGACSARLQYRILQTLDAQGIALADILLETGRFHQIRAQMAHGGMPLLGDLKYGGEESIQASQRLGIRNVALCAYRLEFTHPVTGKKLDFLVKPRGKAFSLFSQL